MFGFGFGVIVVLSKRKQFDPSRTGTNENSVLKSGLSSSSLHSVVIAECWLSLILV